MDKTLIPVVFRTVFQKKMIKKETDILWAWVRSGVWHDATATQNSGNHAMAGANIKEVFSMATRTGLDGFVKKTMNIKNTELENRHTAENKVTRELFAMFHNEGLHPVLLKGQAYARHYSNPTTRIIGDIDVYIPQHEWEQALAFVKAIPNANVDCFSNQKHIEFTYRNQTVEVHNKCAMVCYDMRLDPAFQSWTNKLLSETTDGYYINEEGQCGDSGEWISTPPLLFEVFFCFLHLWLHIVGEVVSRPRSFVDLAVMLRRYHAEIDTKELNRWLEDYHLMDAWQQVGCYLWRNLGLQPTEIPFYSPRYEKDLTIDKLTEYTCFDLVDHKAIEAKAGLLKGRLMALRRKTRSLRCLWRLAPIREAWEVTMAQLRRGVSGIKQRLLDRSKTKKSRRQA